jgi:hypothetical protein
MEKSINKEMADDDFEKRKVYEQPLCVDVDAELKMRFQVWCLQHRHSMKEMFRVMLERFLAEQEEKEAKKK